MNINIKWEKLKLHYRELLKEHGTEIRFVDDLDNLQVLFKFKGKDMVFNFCDALMDDNYCSSRGGRDEKKLFKDMKEISFIYMKDSRYPIPRENLDFG